MMVFLFLKLIMHVIMVLLTRYVEPMVFGDYPKSMRKLVKERLPIFSEEEKKMIKGTSDFIGINYYTSSFVRNAPPSPYPRPNLDSLTYFGCKLVVIPFYLFI